MFCGHAGVGNTFIVCHLLKYVAKRKFFCGGMIHLFLEKVNTVDGLLKLIFEKAVKSYDLTTEEQREINMNMRSDTFKLEFIIKLIN